MSIADALAEKFQDWLQENLGQFLVNLSEVIPDKASVDWKMPVIEEFVVVVAVRDMDDNGGSVMSFASKDAPSHRIRGLLHEALL